LAKKEKNILKDIMQYCAKAEHCTQEVVAKLKTWGSSETESEEIVERLKQENFINEARYANAFVADKWKLDRWGKKKIRHQLQLKNIDDALIEIPLDNIDESEYTEELADQLSRKEKELKQTGWRRELQPTTVMVNRIYNFGVSRGFEEELILKWLESKGYIYK